MDFSRVAIDKARLLAERRGVEIEWVVADLRDFEAPRQGFDLVIMFYLHLTAPERRKVLGKATETLRPEGTLLIVGHDRANLTDG
ncbi:MAG TPA: class I SAM-dependent methyltransferase [Nocardioidaceae bacterium]|nr:class I SAM-dependent methyltransferase [Nocardioidaceae bacterium]